MIRPHLFWSLIKEHAKPQHMWEQQDLGRQWYPNSPSTTVRSLALSSTFLFAINCLLNNIPSFHDRSLEAVYINPIADEFIPEFRASLESKVSFLVCSLLHSMISLLNVQLSYVWTHSYIGEKMKLVITSLVILVLMVSVTTARDRYKEGMNHQVSKLTEMNTKRSGDKDKTMTYELNENAKGEKNYNVDDQNLCHWQDYLQGKCPPWLPYTKKEADTYPARPSTSWCMKLYDIYLCRSK